MFDVFCQHICTVTLQSAHSSSEYQSKSLMWHSSLASPTWHSNFNVSIPLFHSVCAVLRHRVGRHSLRVAILKPERAHSSFNASQSQVSASICVSIFTPLVLPLEFTSPVLFSSCYSPVRALRTNSSMTAVMITHPVGHWSTPDEDPCGILV